jgi:RHS repeat-associated protein
VPAEFLVPDTIRVGYEHNMADELVRADKVNLATSTLLDRETWGLDKGGNWLSYMRTSDNLMQTRAIDNMNRLQQTGGAGTTVIEGGVNELADVTVNSQPAELRSDPATGGYRYRKPVAVTQGTNMVNVTAVDKDDPPNTTSQNWEFEVPGVQRSFTYDANGNTLTDGQRTFTWDAKNRLKTVTKAGTTYEWDYDYRDRRVCEYQYPAGGSKPTIPAWQYLWQDTELVQERTGTSATAGTIKRSHVFGGFEDRSVSGSTTIKKNYLITRDHLGHPREVIIGNTAAGTVGSLAARYDYTAYQGPSKVFGSTVNASLLTIGRYYNHAATGLELALYRAYDPELGRWMSEDPLEDAEIKEGPNLYGFVGNGPVNLVDAHGKQAQRCGRKEFQDVQMDCLQAAQRFCSETGHSNLSNCIAQYKQACEDSTLSPFDWHNNHGIKKPKAPKAKDWCKRLYDAFWEALGSLPE